MGHFDQGQQRQLQRDIDYATYHREQREREQRERERERRDEFTRREAARKQQVAVWAEQDRKVREARERALEADRRARTHAAEAELKANLRAKYMELPGATPAGFVALWPRLLEEHQMREVVSAPSFVDEYAAYRRNTVGRPE